jgi:hypothetical protein
MAQVDSAVSRDIDKLLGILVAQWERLPTVVAEIDRWHAVERIDFIEEWPLEEVRLARLERYAEADALTPDQMARYRELQQLIARNRPILRQLQEG